MMDIADFEKLGLKQPFNRIDPPFGPRDVASILDKHVTERPEQEALADANSRYSYMALDRAADAAANLFSSLGIGAGDRVAASLPNGCDIVIAFLATQRIGAVWVGINRILSPVEKHHILGHSEAKLLLTDEGTAAELDASKNSGPNVDHLLILGAGEDNGAWHKAMSNTQVKPYVRPLIDPFSPAAIMYTSGTTGAPKGVVHSQHNMVTLCAVSSIEGLVRPEARRGVVLPLTITNLMILGPLYAFWNGTACICGTTTKAVPLIEWLYRENVGQIAAVPTMVYDILQTDMDLPENFWMGAGGAPLPEPVRLAFYKRYGRHLLVSYGLTEAPTTVVDSRFLEAPQGASGLPTPHLAISIRDQDGNISPPGEVGEICISAVREGRWANLYTPPLGYWRDPEKTDNLLRGGVLHTGDLGRLDNDGWLYIADRSSELILRGGSNVYPAEIERVLYTHAIVADCAVVGKPDLRLGMRTVAFILPTSNDFTKDDVIKDLTALCRSSLARYKTPDDWIFVDKFPRNAMGKIVKPKLRQELLET